jgi:hypothetical protein
MTALATTNGFGMMLSPKTMDDAMAVAKQLSESQLVPKAFQGRPADILIAGAMGHRLGLDVFASMNSLAVINGRPTLWGDSMLGICQARADWAGMTVTWSGTECTVTVKRRHHSEVCEYQGTFSEAAAKTAGLLGKAGPWTQYPRRMIELRARAFALRAAYADALCGLVSREEMEGVTVDVTPMAVPEPEPARIPAPTPQAEQQPQAEDAPPAQVDLASLARALHQQYGHDALEGIRAICAEMGLAKIGDASAEQYPQVVAALTALEQRLEAAK